MTFTKIAFAAGLIALVAPTVSFANQTSPYERCQLAGHTCAHRDNQVGVQNTVYGELESRGMNSSVPPSQTPDGAQASTKITIENTAPSQIGHGSHQN